ncbi:MAG TPA: hypothetical protein VEX40_19950, partial [Mycobacterium sp.]|nr:hypothetical protein [Mycobacterium sp.]
MGDILIGTEAVASGIVTSHQLRHWYRPIYPNVHAPRGRELTLTDRAVGAWLWSKRRGIITGLAAAALHGSCWIDHDVDVELIYKCPRPPRGSIARNERISPDEWQEQRGLPVANPARTAFDLGRFQRRHYAVAQLDALMRVRPYALEDVMMLAKRYRGRHGVARLKAVLPLVDGGAMSPRETFWRLLVIDAGFPRPTTQIPVLDEFGQPVRMLDFGWEDFKVALEYDGDQHQSDGCRPGTNAEPTRPLPQCPPHRPAGTDSRLSCRRRTTDRASGRRRPHSHRSPRVQPLRPADCAHSAPGRTRLRRLRPSRSCDRV